MENYKDFSKKELVDILDLIQLSVACKTEPDMIKMTGRIKDLLCADQGVCGLGVVNSGQLSKVLKIVNLNYSPEWLSMYASEELYKSDPIIRYNYERFKTHLWSEALEAYREEPQTSFMNKASEFGLKYGVASGICEKGARGSIFSFSGSADRFKGHQKKILNILTPHIHQALVRITVENQVKNDANISSREKEVLKWMKEGKTNWEISVILTISERTVKFHVQNIERKLNAVNKAHAIAIAMDTGLVL